MPEPKLAWSRHPQTIPSSRCCVTSDLSAGEFGMPLCGALSSAQKPKASANLTQSRVVPSGLVSASSKTSNALGSLLA